MRPMKASSSVPAFVSGLLCLLPALGCSQSSSPGTAPPGASAGTPGVAGAAANGGAPSGSGGAGGTVGTVAGASSVSGAPSTTAGATNGGAPSSGGGASGGTGGSSSGGSGPSGGSGGSSGSGGICAPPTVNLSGANAVVGTLIQFNDNGAWCWYQDERALVDTKANKIVLGTVASGGSRNGYVEAVIYDIAAGTKKLYTLGTGLSSNIDDHNAPAFLIRPDGKYFAMWSGHRSDCYSRTSVFDGAAWSAEKKFDWGPLGCPWPGADTNMVTYSNPWYIGSSIYSAVRSIATDPAMLTSSDDGANLSFYGRLMSTKQVGYVAGYFKYWGDNAGRIDFVGTEAHPRDADTSLYHGYIQADTTGGPLTVHDSTGAVKDTKLQDASSSSSTSVDVTSYTPVFKTGTTINGVKLEHAWNHDIVRYADGTIAVLGQARVNGTGTDDPDKRMIYWRFDGTSWKATYLVKGGKKLYPDEQDYIGLSALVPDDPTTIYISTPYDPTTDMMGTSGKHEIWRGTTCDNGATFKWTPVTANSTKDNLRPVVPKWDAGHTALLWMQGTYTSAQSYQLAIVGTITTK